MTGSSRGRSERRVNDRRKKDQMTSASRSNKFDVLILIESGPEVEEVNAFDLVQKGRGVRCRFGSCKERVTDPKEGFYEDKGDEDGEARGSKR